MASAAAAGADADEHPRRDELDALFRTDPHARQQGIELVDWGLGWAEVVAAPTAAQTNFIGSVHGGFLFSLADVALSYAANSWGRISLALSMEVQFVRASRPGADVRACARCRSRTRRVSSFGIDVVDGDGRLLANLQGMNFRTDDWHLDDERWPAAWRERF